MRSDRASRTPAAARKMDAKGTGPGIRMFPPKPGRRQRGVRKLQVGFRCPEHLRKYIQIAEDDGYGTTEVVVKMLDLAKDLVEGLEGEWWEIERRAHLEKVSPGTVSARLLREHLEQERKHPAKK